MARAQVFHNSERTRYMNPPRKPAPPSPEQERRSRIDRRKYIDRRRSNDPLYMGPARRFRVDRRVNVVDRRGKRKLPPVSR
jgi:hypothetical protein